MNEASTSSSRFAVHGIFWRRCIDFIVNRVPSVFHPPLILVAAVIFFFFAGPARRSALHHLGIILPGSSRFANYFRVFRIFQNFGWSLTDAASYRLRRPSFTYELVGEEFLKELEVAKGGVVLTAHLGNADLGAAIFAEKFRRELRIVRAPEPDAMSARHLDESLEQSSAGAVKVEYNTAGSLLSFDLLHALRQGEIISIQGDRVIGDVAQSPVTLFDRRVLLPTGPFVLAVVAQVPIYPLFIVRSGHHRYTIVAQKPIPVIRTNESRNETVATAMEQWSGVLQSMIENHWAQWFAFTPVFEDSPTD